MKLSRFDDVRIQWDCLLGQPCLLSITNWLPSHVFISMRTNPCVKSLRPLSHPFTQSTRTRAPLTDFIAHIRRAVAITLAGQTPAIWWIECVPTLITQRSICVTRAVCTKRLLFTQWPNYTKRQVEELWLIKDKISIYKGGLCLSCRSTLAIRHIQLIKQRKSAQMRGKVQKSYSI